MATLAEVLAAIDNKPDLSEERREELKQAALIALGGPEPLQEPNPRIRLSKLQGAKPLTEPVEIQGTNSENESYIDSLYRAAKPGFDYGIELDRAAYPFTQAATLPEGLAEEYVDPMAVGQGYTSNIRHGTGTGLLRDKLMEDVSFLTEAGREYNPDDPSFLTKTAGNIGATGATIVEELGDLGRYMRSEYEGLGSFLDPNYYRKVFTQPYEDVMANLHGIFYSGYGNTPQQKYQNLMNLYAQNQGIFTPALNKVIERAEPGQVVTQQNVADIVQAAGQLPEQQAIAQQQAQTQQNIINQINQANQNNQNNQGGGGNVSGPAGMSGPSSSASSSAPPRGPDLRFRAQGGIVSINDMIGRM